MGGAGIAVPVGAWYTCVFLATRRQRAARGAKGAVPSTPPPDLRGLQRDYLERIDAVALEAGAGIRYARSSHQELSLLIRSFVRDASGVDAPRMTLAELRAVTGAGQPFSAVADAVGRSYPAAFAAGAAPDQTAYAVPDAVEAASDVVRSWK
ncbi:hypothetical protein ABIB51_002118 [Arthrobacter sp. UYCu712]